jgi:DNA-binding transcriptional ArsR family regulator
VGLHDANPLPLESTPHHNSSSQGTTQNFSLDSSSIIHYLLVVNQLDTTFTALSDPTRRAMIQRLSRGPASVHGLTEPFDLSQQMISKHIAYLVRARIVVKTKRGRESVCTLRPEAIKTVGEWAMSYRRLWEERFDKLDVVIQQMKKKGEGQ